MDENCIVALKNMMRADIVFFKYWYDFQFNIEKYIDEKICPGVFAKYPEKLLKIILSSILRPYIKCSILSECGLSSEVDYDVNLPTLPYAMLFPETIKRVITIMGALICFKDISKIISKKDLDEVCLLIGRDVYTFVIKRSLLFWKKVPNLRENYSNLKLSKRIEMSGKSAFEYILSRLPESVIKRVNLRTGMGFKCINSVESADVSKSINLAKYVLSNFFADNEDARLCLR